MHHRCLRLLTSIVLASCALFGALLVLNAWGLTLTAAHAQGGTGTIRVTTAGADVPGCGDEASPCRTVQYAVDRASTGEQILVAAGVYTNVSKRKNVLGSSVMSQVVFISKTVTVRGGYSAGDWSTSDPASNPTVLNARGIGRVVVISGTATPVLENLQITGGNGPGAGPEEGCCGGVLIVQSSATISGCRIFSNTGLTAGGLGMWLSPVTLRDNTVSTNTATAQYGGGLSIWQCDGATVAGNQVFGNIAAKGGGGLDVNQSDAAFTGNTVHHNQALDAHEGNGGGFHLSEGSDAVLWGNVVQANRAAANGGGIFVYSNTATVQNNLVHSNTAGDRGGGVAMFASRASLASNTVRANTSGEDGGGVCVDQSSSELSANSVLSNTAGGSGGGIVIGSENRATLVNNVVAGNHISVTSDAYGSGIFIHHSTVDLLHNTIADNSGGEANEGVHITGEGEEVSAARFTNTVIAGQDTGLVIHTGNTAIVNGALWFDVNEVEGGAPGHIIVISNAITGNAHFPDRAAGDYHIGANSAAIDRGVSCGVTRDRDDNPRPVGAGPDLGAYEYQIGQRGLYLPVVRKQ